MKLVIQVVTEAQVTVDDEVKGKIGKGFMVLVGIGHEDTRETVDVMIRKMLNLADKDPYDTEYSRELSNLYSKYIDVKEFKAVLKGIDKWCGYRNEHVHAMFNKDLDDLRANYKSHVEDGYELARYIDNQVKRIKSV